MAVDCDVAMRALAEGRWPEWRGLPGGCTLAALDAAFGGSTVLDAETTLGSERTVCTRSSMNDLPLTVWHQAQQALLVEYEIPESPVEAPTFGKATVFRFDVAWGLGILARGEWVVPDRGLALIVRPDGNVVGCLGFTATDIDHYAAALRPRRNARVMPQPRHVQGSPLP